MRHFIATLILTLTTLTLAACQNASQPGPQDQFAQLNANCASKGLKFNPGLLTCTPREQPTVPLTAYQKAHFEELMHQMWDEPADG